MQEQTTPNATIDFDDLPDSCNVDGDLPCALTQSEYQTENEICAEAMALIASWERTYLLSVKHDSCHAPEQLYDTWSAAGFTSFSDMPPPMRYRRVSKNALIG
jgi:hypothetical protein